MASIPVDCSADRRLIWMATAVVAAVTATLILMFYSGTECGLWDTDEAPLKLKLYHLDFYYRRHFSSRHRN